MRFLLILTFVISSAALSAQQRVVVLPFRNMDGEISLNEWSHTLADSLRKSLLAVDTSQKNFIIVDPDSVELIISEFNIDPSNAQYESDVWRAVEKLGATKVVQGNFLRRGERVLMNAYIYDVEFKMADAVNQAKDLYEKPATYLNAVRVMTKKLYPGLK
ncbi:MAG: hypothetical protein HYX66_00370 [Ignavibacteria bacterium]|nr:hypothetical protein [Ignavibacteria bacterium]